MAALVSLARIRLFALALCASLALAAPALAAPATGTLKLQTGSRGAQVLIDGAVVGLAPLPGPWTLPPGDHTVELRPTGKPAVKAAFTVAAGNEAVVELLPEVVEAEVVAPVAGPQRVVYSGPGFSLARAGYITAGVGVASGALAVLFGLQAQSKADEANGLDHTDPTVTRADERRLADDADRAALLCNVTLGVGVVAVAAGVSMVLLASDGPLSSVSLSPAPGGAVIGGAF